MKILLLTDIPPCDNLTAGLVLSAMVRFLPRDSISCFAVVNPSLNVRVSAEFGNMPIVFRVKPNESWSRLPQRRLLRKLSSVISFLGETIIRRTSVSRLINEAVEFGNEQKVDRVWAVLQGQTTIRMARDVADRLGVPLHTHVWDPFSWWADANNLDGISRRSVQALFDDAISRSACVATASEPMAEYYRERFNVSAVPVISSHSRSLGQKPDVSGGIGSTVLLGMAGQFYAAGEWLELVKGLNAAGWKVDGRSVRIVVLGPQRPPEAPDGKVIFLGWKLQHQAAEILAQCDILYCPYPFRASMKEVSQYSFPSKLVLYLAAGRPIVFHGPHYSSPARYISDRHCGVIADRINATAVFNEIERLVVNSDLYESAGRHAQSAFLADFTLESMQAAFARFIGTEQRTDMSKVMIHDHCLAPGSQGYPTELSVEDRQRSFSGMAWTAAKALRDIHIYLRRRLHRTIRFTALKIPLAKSAYHEIVSLHASVAKLRAENIKLKGWLAERDVPKAIPAPLAGLLASVVDALRRDDLSATEYFASSLIFIGSDTVPEAAQSALSQQQIEVIKSSGQATETMSKAVGRVSFSYVDTSNGAEPWRGWDWSDVKASLSQVAIGKLLRQALEEGCDRLVTLGEDVQGTAMAMAVSEVFGLQVYVMVKKGEDIESLSWRGGHPSIRKVEYLSSIPSRMERAGQTAG